MKIEVFGSGCANCKKLENNVRTAVKELGIKAKIIKIEKLEDMLARGVMSVPVLMVDGKAVVKGRVPSVNGIKKLLEE